MSLKSTLDHISLVLNIAIRALTLTALIQTQLHQEPPAPIVVALPLTTLQVIQK